LKTSRGSIRRDARAGGSRHPKMRGKKSCVWAVLAYLFRPVGLVAQLVEQCPFNSKTPILAIFIRFYLPFAIIAELLISLADYDVLLLSLVFPQNPKFLIWVTSRVQVFLCHLNRVDS
jgi:hypothetical protein